MPSNTPPPWFHQKRETPRAYQTFKLYRGEYNGGVISTVGIRNLVELHTITEIPYNTLLNWSSKYKWRDRALAFDNWIDGVERDELEVMARHTARIFRRRRIAECEAVYGLVEIIRQKVR